MRRSLGTTTFLGEDAGGKKKDATAMAAGLEVEALDIHLKTTDESLSLDTKVGGKLLEEASLRDGVGRYDLLSTLTSSDEAWNNALSFVDEKVHGDFWENKSIALNVLVFNVDIEASNRD